MGRIGDQVQGKENGFKLHANWRQREPARASLSDELFVFRGEIRGYPVNYPGLQGYPTVYITLEDLERMQPPKSDTCVICGVRPAETVDHVPPKGFFKGVVNAQLRTVPACRPCNNGASSDDEDVRFFISAQIGKQNPASKKLWEDGAQKTILRKSKLRQAFVATAGDMAVVGEDGTRTTRVAFRVPVSTYQRVFERTARGLYFFHTGRILPATVPVAVTMLAGTPNMDTEDIQMLNVETIGDGACVYRYGVVVEDADCSMWIFEFHHAHWALVSTGALE